MSERMKDLRRYRNNVRTSDLGARLGGLNAKRMKITRMFEIAASRASSSSLSSSSSWDNDNDMFGGGNGGGAYAHLSPKEINRIRQNIIDDFHNHRTIPTYKQILDCCYENKRLNYNLIENMIDDLFTDEHIYNTPYRTKDLEKIKELALRFHPFYFSPFYAQYKDLLDIHEFTNYFTCSEFTNITANAEKCTKYEPPGSSVLSRTVYGYTYKFHPAIIAEISQLDMQPNILLGYENAPLDTMLRECSPYQSVRIQLSVRRPEMVYDFEKRLDSRSR